MIDKETPSAIRAILSQSPTLTAKRPTESSLEFPEYLKNATAYIKQVCETAQQAFEKMLGIDR